MQQPQFLDLYRAGLRTAADVMQASLESAERLQREQLDLLHNAVEDNVKSARELADAKSLDDLMTLQTRYTRAQLERSIDFWSRMWRAAGDNAFVPRAGEDIARIHERKHQERKTA